MFVIFFFLNKHFFLKTDRQTNTHWHCMFVFVQDGSRSEEQRDETQVESYVAQRYIENPYLISGALNLSLIIGLSLE